MIYILLLVVLVYLIWINRILIKLLNIQRIQSNYVLASLGLVEIMLKRSTKRQEDLLEKEKENYNWIKKIYKKV